MRESGVVVSVGDGTVDVMIQPSEACESCGICADGGASGRLLENVPAAANLSQGDSVIVVIPRSARRTALLLVFVVPVAAVAVGYLAGFLLGSTLGVEQDLAGALVAVSAGALAIAGLPYASRRVRSGQEVHAIIARGQRAYPQERNGSDTTQHRN